ncbi:uncharacterized protein LOC133200466 [Saccostrea echinata]|uniref:uncharacterized protein LOC133200466 n=1 Tax=Saccostrea echinata TaxID=191078 RepID=UPI002A805F1E|nr:uncharacterized protein LOC133200466 [Saccostrea echinata]
MKKKDFTTPNQFSVLCEKHFAPNCYPLEYSIKKSMGIEVKKKNLLPEAIPTVQTVDSDKRAEASSLSRHGSPERHSQPKKMRPAFRKRECLRVIQTAISATEVSDAEMESEVEDGGSIQLSNTESTTRSVGLQFGGKSVHKRSKRCQTKLKTMDKAIQANVQKRQHTTSIGIQCNRNLEDLEDLKKVRKRNEWERMRSRECSETTPHAANFTSNEAEKAVWKERKFIVFESHLLELFKSCPSCASLCLFQIKKIIGSLVKVDQTCGTCGYERTWDSQPITGSVTSGNLLLSAAILFTGLLTSKALRFMEHINIQTITPNTFFQHQKHYLHPSICSVWKTFQDNYFQKMIESGKDLTIGGDGRADTPGHSAKFGSYAILNLELSPVINVQLVQSNEVKSSYHMEKEGFIRSINFIKEKGLKIAEIVTDRHVQIVKHVREEMPETIHHFDVWHVAKGLKKKVNCPV